MSPCEGRLYRYVGPPEVRDRAAGSPAGRVITNTTDLIDWSRSTGQRPGPGGLVALTFVVDAHGRLRVADRRSEHVACAGGGPVLSAGELFLDVAGETVTVSEASNQSTGFCPEPESWPAVARALDRAGFSHPGHFTHPVLFRLCEACGERNVVRDGWFGCAVCGAELPAHWNFAR